LFGAKQIVNGVPSYSQAAFDNLKNVIAFMLPQNINVTTASLFEPLSPCAIVIDPVTGHTTEAAPCYPFQDRGLWGCSLYLSTAMRPLRKAFDFTMSKHRLPVYLPTEHVEKLVAGIEQMDDISLFEAFARTEKDRPERIAYLARYMNGTIRAHSMATAHMTQTLESHIDSLEHNGAVVQPDYKKTLLQLIQLTAKFMGEKANEANEPKIDFVKKLLGKSCSFDAMGSANLRKIAAYTHHL